MLNVILLMNLLVSKMKKSIKNSLKKQHVTSCIRRLQKILGRHVCEQDFFDLSFADILRKHKFKSDTDLNEALYCYCNIVFSDKSIHNAIHITMEGESTFHSIPLEQSIIQGLKNEIVKEFNCHSDIAVPLWYLEAKSSMQDMVCSS